MKIHFYATLRAIVGQKTVEVDLPPNTTAQQLIEIVTENRPALQAELLDAENRFQAHMKLFLNGRDIQHLEGVDTPITNDDRMDVFPPVGGG